MAGACVVLAAAGLGAGAVWIWRPARLPVAAQTSAPVAPKRVAPKPLEFALQPAGEAQILANTTPIETIFRFIPNPSILVLDFTDLHQQAMMLNRVAALIEKARLPRDRVLTDAELAAAIAASGDSVDTYYYGHDYSAAALQRFFALADRDHVALTAQEQTLRRLLAQEGLLTPGARGALISIPHAGLDKLIDMAARATILQHELSHGEYFTNPVYAAYTRHFWATGLTDAERAAFVRFLASQGYDQADQDLMMNETQAYLMHTPDPRFFNAGVVGMTQAALDALRAGFLRNMPQGWLRDDTTLASSLAVKN